MAKKQNLDNLEGGGERGWVKTIIVIAVALAILAYLRADVRGIASAIWEERDFKPLWELLERIWTEILVPSYRLIKDWITNIVK